LIEIVIKSYSISIISWWSVLLVEETGENHRPVASHWKTLSHNVVSSTPRHEQGSNYLIIYSYFFFFRFWEEEKISKFSDSSHTTKKYWGFVFAPVRCAED